MTTDNTIKETMEFQAETKQLLDLMVHSIYTNKEIFMRELISNASDAIDKIRVTSLTDSNILEENSDFAIYIIPDEESHTLTISDNGIGMTRDEVIDNIGTIAKSGTKAFLAQLKQKEATPDSELIGQFGVGFYSAFMVADKVTLITRAPGHSTGIKWESTGDGTYSIETTDKEARGTTIILHLSEDFRSSEPDKENFLDRHNIERLVKKYSDYIRYPIKMDFIEEKQPLDADGKPVKDAAPEKTIEVRTLNSMAPLWTKNKSDISTEEYSSFYKNQFHEWEDPLEIIHTKAEGTVEYTTLLFIPAQAPFNFYNRDYTAGIQLYSKHVFIMDNCQELLPEYLRFVRGLVDSPDFSLNISRELLQQSRQLKLIGKNLEKSVIKTLAAMLAKDRTKYEKFWNEFGKALKIGVYTDFANRDKLQDILLFPSSQASETMTSLQEYMDRMPEKQTKIYYATAKDRTSAERLPQMEMLKEKHIEVLYLLDPVDEFAIEALGEYKEKKFQSISREDLDLEGIDNAEAKKNTEALAKENEDLIAAIKKNLDGKITDVKISNRLKNSAVCLVSDDKGVSLSMEQILSEMNNTMFHANRILEINPQHPLFTTLKNVHSAGNADTLKEYCQLLYAQALLMEGLLPDDPVWFADKMASLMAAHE